MQRPDGGAPNLNSRLIETKNGSFRVVNKSGIYNAGKADEIGRQVRVDKRNFEIPVAMGFSYDGVHVKQKTKSKRTEITHVQVSEMFRELR